MATILCVDDDPAIGAILEDTLERAGHRPVRAGSVAHALGALGADPVDLIISDFKMPGLDGIEFLEVLAAEGHDVPLIMLTGFASIEHAVAAIKAGAIDYIPKPIQREQIELAVQQALDLVRLKRENQALRSELTELQGRRQIVGESAAIRAALEQAAAAAPTRATVLLQGESGTGKELFARFIHEASDRRDRPFIHLNCAALPEGLVESALFGHERGAFTGAIKRTAGAFERAHGGTLLLDEVSEMRLDLQAKLLRVLQEQEFERVGGAAPVKVDVRVVATTNRDLRAEAQAGRFRSDLYYRLAVIPIVIPPLRERAGDIPLLAHRFATQAASEAGKEITGLAPDATALLQRHAWPGNVRELQHAMQRAVIMSREPVVRAAAFQGCGVGESDSAPVTGESAHACATCAEHAPAVVLHSLDVREAESVLIREALRVTGGNRSRAAELLGMSVRTLRSKLAAARA